MESRHEDSRDARAMAAAKLAADGLAAKQESTGEENRGLLSSIQDGAKSLLSSVLPGSGNTNLASDEMESAAWRADEAKQQVGGYRGSAAEKALDAKEAAQKKASNISQKAEEYIGAAAEKTGEYKEEALRKAEGAKQRAAGEPKSTPAEKAEEAAKEKTSECTGTAAETKEEAKNKKGPYDGMVADKAGESAAEKAKETQDATVQNAEETKDTVAGKYKKSAVGDTAEKSKGKIGETTESAKQKMDMDGEMHDHKKGEGVATFIEVIKTKLSIPKKEIELGNPWAQGSTRKETKARHGNNEEGDVMKDMCRVC